MLQKNIYIPIYEKGTLTKTISSPYEAVLQNGIKTEHIGMRGM